MFFVRVLCLLGLTFSVVDFAQANPRPDFAVNGQVSGTAPITTLAGETKALFATLSEKVFTLQSGYGRLQTVKTAMDTIATRVSNAGQALAQAIATLSINNSGPIATYYDAVITANNALRSLITGGLTAELNILTANVANYISSEFIDSFNVLAATLTKVQQSITAMRSAVQSARTAAGSVNPIPATTMRRYVTTTIVSNVNTALRELKADVPILVYIVSYTLTYLQNTDQYLLTITDEAQLRAQDVATQADNFGISVNEYAGTLKLDFTDELETPYTAMQTEYAADLEPTLTTISGYGALFDPIFDTMDTIYSTNPGLSGEVDTAFAAFVDGALTLDDGLLEYYGETACTTLQDLIQVLIERGKHDSFCFSKFSQKVFNMFIINTYDTTDCYRLSTFRLENLEKSLVNIIRLIVHDIEDFIELLGTCTLFNDMSICTSYLAGEYTTLLGFTSTKREYLERLLTKETEASLLRLQSCISNSKHLLILDTEEMVADIAQCRVNGPNVG